MYSDVGIKHMTLPVLSVAMVIGNGMLIHVTLTHKRLHTVTNYLVLSLAVSDLLVGCVVIPLMVTAEEGLFGASRRVCLYVFSVAVALVLVSCMTLMCVAVERYIAITRPLKHHALMTPRNVFILITFCWVYASIIASLPVLGWNIVAESAAATKVDQFALAPDNLTSLTGTNNTSSVHSSLEDPLLAAPDCRYQNVMAGSYVALFYPGHFIPLWILLILLYGRIYLRSRNQTCRDKVRRWSRSMQVRQYSVGRMRENWRALRILAIVVGYFLFSWMPVVIWYSLLYRGFTVEIVPNLQPKLPYWFYNLGITLAFGNSAVNPYLYGFGTRSVRKAWIKCLKDGVTRVYKCCHCGLVAYMKTRKDRMVAQTEASQTAAAPLDIKCSQPEVKCSQHDSKGSPIP